MENTRTQQELRLCEKQLPTAWTFKVNDRRRKGLPDVLVLINGICFAIEAKERPSVAMSVETLLRGDTRWALQRAELKTLERAGARAFLMVYTVGTNAINFFKPDLTPVREETSLALFLLHEMFT